MVDWALFLHLSPHKRLRNELNIGPILWAVDAFSSQAIYQTERIAE